MKDDSIEGIYDTLKECAVISKSAGGIGVSVHNIRATGSYIRGTNGTSNGIVPMLRVFNDTARYVDQGGGKRKGTIVNSCFTLLRIMFKLQRFDCAVFLNVLIFLHTGAFAVYLEPWHADIFEFLDLRKNHGKVCLDCLDCCTMKLFLKIPFHFITCSWYLFLSPFAGISLQTAITSFFFFLAGRA